VDLQRYAEGVAGLLAVGFPGVGIWGEAMVDMNCPRLQAGMHGQVEQDAGVEAAGVGDGDAGGGVLKETKGRP
jgi:hypothetical protein